MVDIYYFGSNCFYNIHMVIMGKYNVFRLYWNLCRNILVYDRMVSMAIINLCKVNKAIKEYNKLNEDEKKEFIILTEICLPCGDGYRYDK